MAPGNGHLPSSASARRRHGRKRDAGTGIGVAAGGSPQERAGRAPNRRRKSIGRAVGSDEFCTSAILKPPVVRLLAGPTLYALGKAGNADAPKVAVVLDGPVDHQVEEWVVSGLAFHVGSKRGDYKDFNVFVVSKADIDDPSRASNRNLARDIVEEGTRLNPEGKPARGISGLRGAAFGQQTHQGKLRPKDIPLPNRHVRALSHVQRSCSEAGLG